ncbi:MAG: right-handed parallel beta-helix repeat-containing protein [Pirellulales bacterium]
MLPTTSPCYRAVFIGAWLTVACGAALAEEPTATQRSGLRIVADDTVIRESTRLAKEVYRLSDMADDGLVRIEGDELTIDFQGATLDGSAPGATPDAFTGRGIALENAAKVTIRNARVRGFKIGLYAKNCRELTIENCDFSDNYKQHLQSTPRAESGADWLFGHENDDNEWLRYGAAVYLENCEKCMLRGNTGKRGQNGICLVRSQHGTVADNDFSFNSGWGLALYRASHNTVDHNKFDWCIRGYSHGVYNRGQDSAGILVFEQCSNNTFAFNSATHGGDGFFLFAGLETLDETGKGGCNDNLVFGNDFSHASNNGIEATFSTGNKFISNIMDQADHAIWAGYSYGSRFENNRITRCNHGISIEHGGHNRIQGNKFSDNGVAVNLWANEKSSFAEKPYGRDHDCLSHDYIIYGNQFEKNQTDIRLARTDDVDIRANDGQGAKVALDVSGTCQEITVAENNLDGEIRHGREPEIEFANNYFRGPAPDSVENRPKAHEQSYLFGEVKEPAYLPQELTGKQDAFLPPGALRGLQYIFVDEWGPYDFESVKIMPSDSIFWNEAKLTILGLKPPYRVENLKGGVKVEMENPAEGGPVICHVTSPDRKPRKFSFDILNLDHNDLLTARGLLLFADWNVKFYPWQRVGAGQPPADWKAVVAGPVLEERRLSEINFSWGGRAPGEKVPAAHFAAVCSAELDLPDGTFQLRSVSDDGIRVTVDGKLVIDNWTWHGPTEDRAVVPLTAGKHQVRIDYFQIDGASQLQFWVEPVKPTEE